MDRRYYINVREVMDRQLPRPRLKPQIFICDGEWLPLISVDVGRCQ